MAAPSSSASSSNASFKSGADVRLVSSDNMGFPTQKGFLSAASEVFADMLATASSSSSTDADSILPKVKLEEHSKDLKLFIMFVDRTAKRPQLLSRAGREVADKYQAPIVADMARMQLRRFIESSPAVVFGLAVATNTLELAQSALGHFDGASEHMSSNAASPSKAPSRERIPTTRTAAYDGFSPGFGQSFVADWAQDVSVRSAKKRTRDVSLSDIPIHYLRRFSAETIHNYSVLEHKDGRSWAQKASSFKIV